MNVLWLLVVMVRIAMGGDTVWWMFAASGGDGEECNGLK